MSSVTDQAMDRPSNVEVPRPISSSKTSDRLVARLRMWATSIISIMKVERPRLRSSLAPTRVKIRSTKPIFALCRYKTACLCRTDINATLKVRRFAAHAGAGDQQEFRLLLMTTSFGTKPASFQARGRTLEFDDVLSLISGLVQPPFTAHRSEAPEDIDRGNAGQHRRGWTHGRQYGVRGIFCIQVRASESAVSNKSSRWTSSSVVYLDPLVSCCFRRHSGDLVDALPASMYHPTCRFLTFKEGMFNSSLNRCSREENHAFFAGTYVRPLHRQRRVARDRLPQDQRCLLIQDVLVGFIHLVQLLKPLAQVHQEGVLTVFAPLCDGRHSFQCVGRGDQITRIAALISQLGCQSFHVSNPFERGSHPVQPPCRTSQRPNSGMTGLYGCWVGQRVKHPCFEQAPPHGRAAPVQCGEQATVVFSCQCGG